VLADGELWCWGTSKALLGASASCSAPAGVYPPTKVPATSAVVEIAANRGAIVARTADGNVWTVGATWDPSIDCVGKLTLRNPPPG
jgi:alpha-tubulin suppressor-like RCC1 family protein